MMNKTTLSPYQKGVAKALSEMGEQHATEAVQQGVPPQHIEEQSGLSGDQQQAFAVLQQLLGMTPQDGQKTTQPQQPTQQPQGAMSSATVNNGQVKPEGWGVRAVQGLALGGIPGLLYSLAGQNSGDLLKQQLTQSEINKNKTMNLTPEQEGQMIADYNSNLPEGYQVVHTAEGFFGRPKSALSMNMLPPEEADRIANSMLIGDTAPSQLARQQRNQVIDAALAKDPTFSPAKADIDFAVNKVGASNFEKLYNNVTSFEKTFRKNADVALKLSENFDRTKIPLINRAIMAGKLQIAGDPEASKMLVSLYTVATEYARLTSAPGATGSMITDSAREEARSMLSEFASKGQIKGLLDPEVGIMSIDAKNRIDALNETRNDIKGRYGKKGIETGSVPKVGETFNGEKVLKVTRI